MNKIVVLLLFCFTMVFSQKKSPASYWESLKVDEKTAFINYIENGNITKVNIDQKNKIIETIIILNEE